MVKTKIARVLLPILLSLTVIAALYINADVSERAMPAVSEGILDLNSWEKSEGKAFQLAGQWEFYWDRLLSYGDIKAGGQAFTLVDAPSQWNDYGDGLPGKGKGTYRIHVEGAVAGTHYGVRIQNMASAYRLYADDVLIAQNGSFGDKADAPASGYRPQLAGFTAESGSFDFILQVGNDAYAVGGMWEPVIFGTYKEAYEYNTALSFMGYFSLGSLAVMCIFFLIFFIAQRKEKEVLILSGIGLMVIFRLMIYGDMSITYLLPDMPISGFGWIDYLTLIWVQFFLLYFVYSTYTALVRRWQITALLIYSVCVSLFVAFFPFEIVSSAYMMMNLLLLFINASVVVHLARAAYDGKEDAPALLGAMALILFLLFYEMFINDYSLTYFFIMNAAFEYTILFFIQCFIVARRYSKARKMEIALLKNQIHPHFIHNALATIISVSRKDTERSRELLIDFSSYLRGCYDYESEELIPIAQEIEFIRAYAALEQARFGDRFKVEYRIEAESILLPPLILQPLVENAFIHGLREKKDGGTVLVYAVKTKSGTVRIGVRDDGVGLGHQLKESSERQGIGIENINRRLSKLYRTQLVFTVPEGGGCEVCMDIPCKEAALVESSHY